MEQNTVSVGGELGLPAMRNLRLYSTLVWFNPLRTVGTWTYGPRTELNAAATWETAAGNLMVDASDMTGAAWAETGSGSVNNATHFTFAAQNDAVHQSVTPASGTEVTLFVKARAVSGNTSLHLYHSGLTPASTAKTFTGTLANYAVTVTADGGAVLCGIQDQNAGGFGQIEVTQWAVIPGSHTAAEAAALWEDVEANRQRVTNWLWPDSRRVNELEWSEDLTEEWVPEGGAVITATTVEDDNAAGYEGVKQDVAAANNTQFTWTAWVAKDAVAPATRFPAFQILVGAAYYVTLDTQSGASATHTAGLGGSHTVTSDTVDGTPAWRLSLTFTTDDTAGIKPIIYPSFGANADIVTQSSAAVGTITVLQQQLELGSAFTAYQLKDSSNYNWADACGGDDCSSTNTNTGADLVGNWNESIPGTSDDLEHASWTFTDAAADNATQFTPSALDGQAVQSFTGVNGSVYIVSATIASAGNTALEWTLDGVETSETVTASEVRYSIEYTGDGAAADIGLRDPNAAGFGAITFTDFQIERAPTGSTPLPYISSAEPTLQCVGCVKATDDFDTADAVAAGFSGEDVPITVMAVVRTDSVFVASNDIFTLGRSSTDNPRWRVGV
ncbi:MAG: hypothetical protein ACYSTZ_09550, partial [Planctomycetota bacterium]